MLFFVTDGVLAELRDGVDVRVAERVNVVLRVGVRLAVDVRVVVRDPVDVLVCDLVLDDDGGRHVVATARGRRGRTALEGSGESVHRVGSRVWRVPVTGFWQSHRDAPAIYSELVRQWLSDTSDGSAAPADSHGSRAWDLYGGVGLFAAALADTVGDHGEVLTVDTSRLASNVARSALADLPQVRVLTDSVRRVLATKSSGADIAVLDPPRAGAHHEHPIGEPDRLEHVVGHEHGGEPFRRLERR